MEDALHQVDHDVVDYDQLEPPPQLQVPHHFNHGFHGLPVYFLCHDKLFLDARGILVHVIALGMAADVFQLFVQRIFPVGAPGLVRRVVAQGINIDVLEFFPQILDLLQGSDVKTLEQHVGLAPRTIQHRDIHTRLEIKGTDLLFGNGHLTRYPAKVEHFPRTHH
uniref:Uncharacterized protein n=1 Tax=uncultured proteobacterium Rifle_16ft_4_minimus_11209 TaxID=1665205 RepID=A0A0H4T042_9PROT|nr:hypothetical protein [uncultured proteobacterium Rifle_16ft_4_minimus_11209]